MIQPCRKKLSLEQKTEKIEKKNGVRREKKSRWKKQRREAKGKERRDRRKEKETDPHNRYQNIPRNLRRKKRPCKKQHHLIRKTKQVGPCKQCFLPYNTVYVPLAWSSVTALLQDTTVQITAVSLHRGTRLNDASIVNRSTTMGTFG